MKILTIRGKNLASLEGEFEIDFTTEPLRSAGIFAITGNTGAGKSTILDALCLALFDDTPRTNRATENIAIPDVRDKLINQKDCRTILRRGTGEGYAEVDFVSLGGEKFRSRWMVKRARGKADGSMQNSEIRLTNLSTTIEQQGRKTELLVKITELIGLTFDQFTRSVLLAQGDFATFLKAKQSEKAELLEKLTGTEVYSRISMGIYEKSKFAEQDYVALKLRINDIELMPPEVLLEIQAEKQKLVTESSGLKEEIQKFIQKIKWMDDEKELIKFIHQANEERLALREEIEKAAPRYQYMVQIEKVQEIRDVYREWKRTLQQNSVYQLNRQQQLSKTKANEQALEQARIVLDKEEKERKEFEEKVSELEPQFIRARELDVKVDGLQNNLSECYRDYQLSCQMMDKLEKSLIEHRKQITEVTQVTEKLKKWFDGSRKYETLISRIDLVISLLDDISTTTEQLQVNRKILVDCGKLLEQEQAARFRLQQEADRLQQLLPAEIMTWRLRLQEGQPCPVCGSLQHPFKSISDKQTLQEEVLEKAKKEVAAQLAELQAQVESRQAEMARLNALIENYGKHEVQAKEKAQACLAVLPDWMILFEKGSLQHQLKELAEQWEKYTVEQILQNEKLGQLQVTAKFEETNLGELQDTVKVKEAKYLILKKELERLKKERGLLLKGKAVVVVEKACNERKKVFEERIRKCTENLNNTKAKQEACKATLLQTEREIEELSGREKALQNQVRQWLVGQKDELSMESLEELLAKESNWIQEEKRLLGGLKEREKAVEVTLTERNNHLLRHRQSEYRPQQEMENRDVLQKVLLEKNDRLNLLSTRLAEIELSLVNHKKNEARIKMFEKELTAKRNIAENWKKLNDLFGSASGSKFKEIAQGYTLNILLEYANKHLQGLSERYQLQRIPDTLALQVADLDMLGETRAVHSLSGGESFLISLALALGLASLSSNRMRVESLFIDEGFGSLDADTLRIAMDALERLQNQGRKIGVISHVPEMAERITTRIQVSKSSNGRSRIRIIG